MKLFEQIENDMNKLLRPFYNRATIIVAKELLGKYMVHCSKGIERIGRIVEVEAYLANDDRASHSFKGRTARNNVMFGPPGFAYVYLIYGMYNCMNVVTEAEGIASAVLIRALEPVQNLDGKTCGPGLLSMAMGIDRQLNGCDLEDENFYLAASAESETIIVEERARIGVAYAGEWADKLLRFYVKGSPFISKH